MVFFRNATVICTYTIALDLDIEIELPDDFTEEQVDAVLRSVAMRDAQRATVSNADGEYGPSSVEVEDIS